MKDKTFVTLAGLFFLLFIGGIIAVALENPTAGFFTRASSAAPSPLKSFAITYPTKAARVGDTVKVSVYIRDVNGTSLPGRSVKLSANSAVISISPSDTLVTNDAIGQAQFFITSATPQKIVLTITDVTSNPPIEVVQVPTVEFIQ
jgi:hypothetical protein